MHLLISPEAAFVNFPLKYPEDRRNTDIYNVKNKDQIPVGMFTSCEAADVAREKFTKALSQVARLRLVKPHKGSTQRQLPTAQPPRCHMDTAF